MNTRISLAPLNCPRPGCGRPMQPLFNGGTLYLRCSESAPRCGIMGPAETIVAWTVEKDQEHRAQAADELPLVKPHALR